MQPLHQRSVIFKRIQLIVRSSAVSWLLISCLYIAFTLNCSTQPLIITNVYRPENLTATALAEGGVAIIGIINRNPESDGDDGDVWADLLYTIFEQKRPEFHPIPQDKAIQAIGKSAYQAVIHDFKELQQLNFGSLKQIPYSELAFRYLLLGSIDQDRIIESKTKETIDEPQQPVSFEGQAVAAGTEKTWIRRTTTRSVRVTLTIFDVQEAKKVWSGTIEDRDSTTLSYGGIKDSDWIKRPKAWLGNLFFDSVYGPMLQPKARPIKPMLEKIFTSFAQQLP